MQECKKCRITIRGNKRCCPLCQGRLYGEPEDAAFPIIKKLPITTEAIFRIACFLAVLAEIALGMICFVNGGWIPGIEIAMVIILFALGDLGVALYYKSNLVKLITIQAYIVMVAVYVLDARFSDIGWSVEWVIPCMFIALIISTLIIARVNGLFLRDIMLYVILDVLLSFIQIYWIKNGTNRFPWPAAISIALMLAIAAFVIIFRFNDLKNASAKYLNM